MKLELAQHFKVGEREAVQFTTRFTSIRLVKQEDLCGAIALTYFVENCLDLP